jgi:hypothetical protein
VAPDQDKAFESLLRVPLWFWNSAEWCSFTQATAKTQRPTLVQALREVRDGIDFERIPATRLCRRFFRTALTSVQVAFNAGDPWGAFPKPKSFSAKLDVLLESTRQLRDAEAVETKPELNALIDVFEALAQPRAEKYANHEYTLDDVNSVIAALKNAFQAYGGQPDEADSLGSDAPTKFTGEDLIRAVEATAELLGVSEHCETLLMRIRGLLSDTRMKPLVSDQQDETLQGWLDDYLSNDGTPEASISVLDLSLVPAEVCHLITAVVSRVVFESLQRYRKVHGDSLPTVLVMEEAHTFVKRYKNDSENPDASSVCCQVFERIAREGRKFGLGLVLSSQRPSELSQTVLSQCNSFLLHRISNDRDQDIVAKLVPDNMRGLLRELPSLPSASAVLLGWASELPILVRLHELPEAFRPHSEDPAFWDVWTGKDEEGANVIRPPGWAEVIRDWVGPTEEDANEA